MKAESYTRREFLRQSVLGGAGLALAGCATTGVELGAVDPDAIIDIHQHTNYLGRTPENLLAHQRAMGISRTILLPAGRPVIAASTRDGFANALQAAAGGNDVCYQFARQHPKNFFFGANDVPDQPGALEEIEKYLKLGAKVIGELKFSVECDSPEMQNIYRLAERYDVPVLMHWEFGAYNHGFERFHTMLEKYPKVRFVGHAQTWWANIDKGQTADQTNLYPKTPVTPGGLTDRLLGDYSNVFGDLSAGSGLNSLTRDEEQARAFLQRHQDKVIYGSDCADPVGDAPDCQGGRTIATIRRLAGSRAIERKIFQGNAKKVFRL